MINQKLIVGAAKTTLVIYENGNVNAKGGRLNQSYKAYYKTNNSSYKYSNDLKSEEPIIAGLYHTKNYKQRKKNRQIVFRDLIENNFKIKRCLFITLTFAPTTEDEPQPESVDLPPELKPFYIDLDLIKIQNDLFSSGNAVTKIANSKFQDLAACHTEFKKFIQRMNYRYDNFKYVAVFSKQTNTGFYHYHMLCNLDFIKFDELKSIWELGSAYIRSVKSKTAMNKTINYCVKNMYAYSAELEGEKGYLSSRGLNRSLILRSWEGKEEIEFDAQKRILNAEIKKGLKHTNLRITEHKYVGECKATADDDIFIESEHRSCICKYYTYYINSEDHFEFVVATRKERKIKP